ncbi:hypothetical protein EUTSA_v10008784mg [Eutrema salsugineum]|uniref:Armadillo repeat-containing domain-containing protein n=1 Tax=Eutrema salsugineum TaxID=72664 RepID=V4L756_EUTSA|nr:hypothetical protein EUTSA_v10008784mg [Eutrema salsugineum]
MMLTYLKNTKDETVQRDVACLIANFAQSRESRRKSTLIEDGALSWIIEKSKTKASTIKLHIEVALCSLAQHEANAKKMVKEGAMWELVRIYRDSSREDLRILAHQILTSSPIFLSELKHVCDELRDIDGTPIYREYNSEMTIENDLLQHINIIYEAVLAAEKENVILATYYKGKEQLADLCTTLLETTWAEELKSKLGVTLKWIKNE